MKNACIHVRVATFFLFHEMILISTINTMIWIVHEVQNKQ